MTAATGIAARITCPRHSGQCAGYSGTEPHLCSGCHAQWYSIEHRADYEGSHDLHLRVHEQSCALTFVAAQKKTTVTSS